jgi:hypothetical protein
VNAFQRRIEERVKTFEGKTVRKVEASSANLWMFYFTDGSALEISTESFGHGISGLVPDTDPLRTEVKYRKEQRETLTNILNDMVFGSETKWLMFDAEGTKDALARRISNIFSELEDFTTAQIADTMSVQGSVV